MISDVLMTFGKGLTGFRGSTGLHTLGVAVDLTAVDQHFVSLPPMYIVFLITNPITGGDSTTTTAFKVQTGTGLNSDGRVNTGSRTLFETHAYSIAELNAGPLVIPLGSPPGGYSRYLDLRARRAGTVATGGSGNVYLTLDADVWRSYPDAAN